MLWKLIVATVIMFHDHNKFAVSGIVVDDEVRIQEEVLLHPHVRRSKEDLPDMI